MDEEDVDTRERQIGRLTKASDELGCDDQIVPTWDQEGEEVVDGKRIGAQALWHCLLS